jgi:superfamily I DNA and/or RNA helicase
MLSVVLQLVQVLFYFFMVINSLILGDPRLNPYQYNHVLIDESTQATEPESYYLFYYYYLVCLLVQ